MWHLWAILAGARRGRHPEEGIIRSVNWAAWMVFKLFLVFCLVMGVAAVWSNHQETAAEGRRIIWMACIDAHYGGSAPGYHPLCPDSSMPVPAGCTEPGYVSIWDARYPQQPCTVAELHKLGASGY